MSQTARFAVLSSQEPDARQAAGRATWGTISREDIVLAAVKVVTAGGYEQMTIRGLAGELGVAPMSLARELAAYTTAEQFMAGLRYLLEGIGTHTETGLVPGIDLGRQP